MNRALPEMLHCLNKPNCSDMTVLEKQRSMTVKWQNRQHQEQSYFNGTHLSGGDLIGEAVNRPVKPDPGSENGWPELGRFEIPSSGFGSCGFCFNFNSAISRTASCPPAVAAAAAAAIVEADDLTASEKMCSAVGRESFKKRKAQNNTKVAGGEIKDKRIKVCTDEPETAIEQKSSNRETIVEASKDDSKASEVQNQKPDYIHVRARRGQATDSHSLAERVRREKISERMKYLQDLVPGCNKITGKAGMLDEIINYVQSLQRQVEFLSMKIATLNPQTDFNIDNVFAKEMFPSTTANYPIMMSPEMATPAYLQFNQTQQAISGCALEIGLSSSEMVLRRTISAPVSLPEPFMDSSCFTQIHSSSDWNGDLQNLYNV